MTFKGSHWPPLNVILTYWRYIEEEFSEKLLLFFGIHMANAAIFTAWQMAADMKKAV